MSSLLGEPEQTINHYSVASLTQRDADAIKIEYKEFIKKFHRFGQKDWALATEICQHLLVWEKRWMYILFYMPSSVCATLHSLPLSVASAERSLSTLRRLKTYLRSSVGTDGLTALALSHTHYPSRHVACMIRLKCCKNIGLTPVDIGESSQHLTPYTYLVICDSFPP